MTYVWTFIGDRPCWTFSEKLFQKLISFCCFSRVTIWVTFTGLRNAFSSIKYQWKGWLSWFCFWYGHMGYVYTVYITLKERGKMLSISLYFNIRPMESQLLLHIRLTPCPAYPESHNIQVRLTRLYKEVGHSIRWMEGSSLTHDVRPAFLGSGSWYLSSNVVHIIAWVILKATWSWELAGIVWSIYKQLTPLRICSST